MEFEHSEKVRALQARVETFMADEIYPNEEALFAQVNEGDRWQPVPLLDEFPAFAPNTVAAAGDGQHIRQEVRFGGGARSFWSTQAAALGHQYTFWTLARDGSIAP